MIKKIAMLLVVPALALSFAGCDASTTTTDDGSNDNFGGPAITYGGKPGIDLGGGLVMPYDGSGVTLGFGY